MGDGGGGGGGGAPPPPPPPSSPFEVRGQVSRCAIPAYADDADESRASSSTHESTDLAGSGATIHVHARVGPAVLRHPRRQRAYARAVLRSPKCTAGATPLPPPKPTTPTSSDVRVRT